MKSLSLLLVLAGIANSCGRSHFDSTRVRIPWPSATGGVSFQTVSVPTLSDPEHLSGTTAHILVEPGDGGARLSGTEAAGRYIHTSDGVLIPTDFTTMQAVTAYAHQERLRDLDRAAGADSSLAWPLSIGVQVKLIAYGQASTNNAVYDAKLNSLLLVPYNMGALPIPLNGGVLAHEHFHFIFQALVMSHVQDAQTQTNCSGGVIADEAPRIPEKQTAFEWTEDQVQKTAASVPPRILNAYVLRGMNEGFADFWGWLYSDDDSFLARSIPQEDEWRRLDADAGRLPNEALVRRLLVDTPTHPDRLLPDVSRAHMAYSLGTIYARYLRSLVKSVVKAGQTPNEAKLLVARALIGSLPSLAASVDASYETGFINPNSVLEPLLQRLPAFSIDVCRGLEKVRAFNESYKKPVSCQAFHIPVGGGA